MSYSCAQNACVLTPVGMVCILAAGLFCCGVKDLGLNSIKRKRCTKASIKLRYSEAVVAKTIQEQLCLTDGGKKKKKGSKCPNPLEILREGYAGKVGRAAYSIEKAKLLCRDFFAADISCQSICAEMDKLQSQKETFI